MILIDSALKQRAEADDPVPFALFGAGFMGRGIVNQVVRSRRAAMRSPATRRWSPGRV